MCSWFLMLTVVVLAGFLHVFFDRRCKNTIVEWAAEREYRILSVKRRLSFTGPYKWATRFDGVYEVHLQKKNDSEIQVYWLRLAFTRGRIMAVECGKYDRGKVLDVILWIVLLALVALVLVLTVILRR